MDEIPDYTIDNVDEETIAWQEAQDLRAVPTNERVKLAVNNLHLGRTNLNEEHVEEVRAGVIKYYGPKS